MLQSLLDSFKIEPKVLLFNGILFLLLVQILDKLFWKPVQQHLESRKQEIANAYRTVDETRRDMENLRGEYQAKLAAIEADARARIQQTVRDAQHQREELIAQARALAEQTIRDGAAGIERERERLLGEMKDRFDDAAGTALSRVIGSGADSAQKKLIDEYITQHVLQV